MPVIKNIFACPICGEATKVLRTQAALPQRITRYRICENGHRTTTREIVDADMNSPRSMVDRTLVTVALSELVNALGIELTSTVPVLPIPENPSHESSNHAT